jgi:hypothetical protein
VDSARGREPTASFDENDFGNINPVPADHIADEAPGRGLPRQTISTWNSVLIPGQDNVSSPYMLPTPTLSSNYPANASPSTHRQEQPPTPVLLNFKNVHLVPLADSSRLGSRWLNSLITSTPPKRIKPLSQATVTYSYRILKTYPKMMLQPGRLPPIIHPLQLKAQETLVPLANCLSLVRMWEGRAEGSEDVVNDILVREMEKLFNEVLSPFFTSHIQDPRTRRSN